jgi:dienelactone hydrolase
MQSTRTLLSAFLLALISPAWAGQPTDGTNPPTAFDVPAGFALHVQVTSRTIREGMTVEDLSFLSPAGRRVAAYLVKPPAKGRFPAILYLHWLGDPATSNRNEFLPEALALAHENVVSLLTDCLWLDEKAFPWTGRDAAHDREQCVRAAVEARLALDLLSRRGDVDTRRLAIVGHDFGAMTAAQIAGVDPRVRIFVLMAGTPHYHYWFFRSSKLEEALRPGYISQMSPVDPAALIAKAKGADFLFQFSRGRDKWVSEDEAREFFQAAAGVKQILWYADTDHSMKSPAVSRDRLDWLRERLSIPPRPND